MLSTLRWWVLFLCVTQPVSDRNDDLVSDIPFFAASNSLRIYYSKSRCAVRPSFLLHIFNFTNRGTKY